MGGTFKEWRVKEVKQSIGNLPGGIVAGAKLKELYDHVPPEMGLEDAFQQLDLNAVANSHARSFIDRLIQIGEEAQRFWEVQMGSGSSTASTST